MNFDKFSNELDEANLDGFDFIEEHRDALIELFETGSCVVSLNEKQITLILHVEYF